MSGQSKKMSLAEIVLSTAIGFGIAMLTQVLVFPWFGIHIPATDHALIGVAFTVVSVVRGYYMRRFFNWLHQKGINL